MIARIAVLALLAPLVAGCNQTTGGGSIAGGESKVFAAPPYVVKGKAPYDQNIIDEWVEGGVAAYGWKRPAARPAALDAKPARGKVAAVPKKKPGLIKRIKDRVTTWPPAATAPVVDTPVPPAPVVAPALPPRDAVDELLNPTGR